MDFLSWNISAAWISMLLGCISGALLSHELEGGDGRGSYSSIPQTMRRLGHISFFGLALVNFAFVATVRGGYAGGDHLIFASYALIAAMFTMPLFCFLSARNRDFRHGFVIPVGALVLAIMQVIGSSLPPMTGLN